MQALQVRVRLHSRITFSGPTFGRSALSQNTQDSRCQLCSRPSLSNGFRFSSPPSSQTLLHVSRTEEVVAVPIAESPESEETTVIASTAEVLPDTEKVHGNDEAVSEVANTGVLAKFLVSKAWATAIIGRAGVNVQRISQETGANIQLSSRTIFYPGTQNRTLLLRGEIEQITQALLAILQIKDTLPLQQANPSEVGYVGMLLPISVCGLVLGQQATTLAQLKADSGCNIVVTSRDKQIPNVPDRSVWLTGTKPQIVSAVKLILELLTTQSNYNEVVRTFIPTDTQQLILSNKAAGVILGKGGQTITQLQAVTGVKMVLSDKEENNDRVLTMYGTPSSVQLARKLVTEKLRAVNLRYGIPGRNKNSNSNSQELATSAGAQSSTGTDAPPADNSA